VFSVCIAVLDGVSEAVSRFVADEGEDSGGI
jgi:hypothetical protein